MYNYKVAWKLDLVLVVFLNLYCSKINIIDVIDSINKTSLMLDYKQWDQRDRKDKNEIIEM